MKVIKGIKILRIECTTLLKTRYQLRIINLNPPYEAGNTTQKSRIAALSGSIPLTNKTLLRLFYLYVIDLK